MIETLSEYPILWLIVLFLVNFMGNGTIPMPISVYILWLGQFHMPVPVVIVGTLGTVLGWIFVGSKILQRMLRDRPQDMLNDKLPEVYRKLFNKWPKTAVFIFNAVPFPWDVMRILAIMSGIKPLELVLPLALGRVIRYSILVTVGAILSQYKWFLWALIGLILIPVIFRCIKPTSTPSPDAGQVADKH